MMMRRISSWILAFIAIFAVNASARSQTPAPAAPCPSPAQPGDKSTQNKPQTDNDPCASGKEPSAADRFPFPGESQTQKPKQQDAPDAPAPSGKQPTAADKFPFPGSAPPMPGSEPESPGSSSSSSSSSSADDPGNTPSTDKPPVDDKTPPKNVRRRLPKIEKLQSDEERAEEDLKVSKYYEQAGSLNAAYLRAQDAVKSLPSDPETHFALAHIAQKLEKKDEAIAEYNAYLKLDPDGLKIKQAQKALDQLQH
jgi:tetratricopeptide (TPR) repeat protein